MSYRTSRPPAPSEVRLVRPPSCRLFKSPLLPGTGLISPSVPLRVLLVEFNASLGSDVAGLMKFGTSPFSDPSAGFTDVIASPVSTKEALACSSRDTRHS